jgi:primosomal protein N' (replication factor Y)
MRCACGGGFADEEGRLACQTCRRPASAWQCPCGSTRWRAITLGSARTAQELAQAFATVPVLRSDSTTPLERVGPGPAIVIATPGCEPPAEGGYPLAVILDAQGFLARPDIHVGEEAVRRWLGVAALVRPGDQSGLVLIVGGAHDRAVQAVVRRDPVGYAQRELADRVEAGFPPATRMAVFTGTTDAVGQAAQALGEAGFVELLGPIEDGEQCQLIARAPAAQGAQLAALLARLAASRSPVRSGKLTVRLDPDWLGA